MAQAPKATILDHFASWTTHEWSAPGIISWWTSWQSPSAPPSAEPIPGFTSNFFGNSSGSGSNLPGTAPRHSLPRHLRRRFRPAGPHAVADCFVSWTQAFAELLPGEVAIDGKTARRSYDRAGKKGAIHMVSAWATQQSLTLGQVKTDEKSNEITAIPQLLELLDLNGCIVTIDAMAASGRLPSRSPTAGRLRAVGEVEPGSTVRRHSRPVCGRRGIGL